LPKGISLDVLEIARDGAPSVRALRVRRAAQRGLRPALLWMHGGGYIVGHPKQDVPVVARFALELEITVIAVRYRLAPQSPFPAALEDCYAALRWMHREAAALGVDRDRIAVGGMSAGGGLAASLAQMAKDRAEVDLCLQLLSYPMIDDRTTLRTALDESHYRLWRAENNRFAWRAYLGVEPGATQLAPYAAAARRDDLSGLPPAWIGVPTLDLFYDEDVAYARRLSACGVETELHVAEGAFHGFDVVSPRAAVSEHFRASQINALARAFALCSGP
jgi:acetyl esterase/lipase